MEDLEINKGENYILIDALYLSDIRSVIDELDIDQLHKEIRRKAFPYNGIPFAAFTAQQSIFSIRDIVSIHFDAISKGDQLVFSSDTGLILLINEKILLDVARKYDYGQLVDASPGPINKIYWAEIIGSCRKGDIGLILSPGLNAPVDFSGSGSYRVVVTAGDNA